jgi:predicted DNA-binding transcriptional regulator AlpA
MLNELPDLPDITEVSSALNIPVPTLRWYRATGTGPKSFKVGRHVRYHKTDVLEWIAAQENKTARGGAK